jgi:hypothetical protein
MVAGLGWGGAGDISDEIPNSFRSMYHSGNINFSLHILFNFLCKGAFFKVIINAIISLGGIVIDLALQSTALSALRGTLESYVKIQNNTWIKVKPSTIQVPHHPHSVMFIRDC